MRDKYFRILLISVMSICVMSTAALTIYTVYLHQTCSILSYIANEGR